MYLPNGLSTECPNCLFDFSLQKSSGLYKPGGPYPFELGAMCPYCSGEGKLLSQTDSKRHVKLRIVYDTKPYRNIENNSIRVPNAQIITLGYIKDLYDVLRCSHIVIEDDVLPPAYSFKLVRDGGDQYSIVQGKYFRAYWERVA